MSSSALFDVRAFGAKGDGCALDTGAVNRAIRAAAASGGGATVVFPPGRYLCFSIRLASGITLLFSEGSVIEAADPARHPGRYDLPEDGPEALYQDFGHSHWQNSLIWGDSLENVAILGKGRIEGTGLTRDGPGARWRKQTGERPLSMLGMTDADILALEPPAEQMKGLGNKAIAFKNCRNVILRDFTIVKGGHFAILATGVDGLVIDGLHIDTDRDGIDLDCVRNVRVSNCRVNSPNDDAIVLKSSLALGKRVLTEYVLIENCIVTGYDLGTSIDGRFGRTQHLAPDRDPVTGRIKLGTESNGGFCNITIRNCRFERSRGLALETVDGGTLEKVDVHGIVMREVTSAPLFLRLGDRRRGPEGTGVGTMRQISISEVEAVDIDHRYAATIAGLPEHRITDVSLRKIRLVYRGGGVAADAGRKPPLLAEAYPEPSMFGPTPAWGLWVRHAANVMLEDLRLETVRPDARPRIVKDDAEILN